MILKGSRAQVNEGAKVSDVREDRDDGERGTTRSDDNRPTLLRSPQTTAGPIKRDEADVEVPRVDRP